MAPLIQEFSSTAYVVLLSAVLCLVIKFVFVIVIINREQRVEENQPPQQPLAAAEARNLTRNDDDVNQNHNIQRIRQIPREHDERQG